MRWAAGAAAIAVLLAGCTTPAPPGRVSTSASSSRVAPAPQSDDLEAARLAYLRYLEVYDQVTSDPQSDAHRLDSVAIGEALTAAMSDVADYRNANLHTSGNTTLGSISLQSATRDFIVVYVCEDFSAVDVLDESEQSVVDQNRESTHNYEATLTFTQTGLLVSDLDDWSALPSCTDS